MRLLRVFRREKYKRKLRLRDPIQDTEWIVRNMVLYHPVEMEAAVYGFFSTIGSPKISRLLAQTGFLLKEPKRRIEETNVYILVLASRGLDHPASIEMIRRVNFIHSRFPIEQDDYLYVLSVFTLRPLQMNAIRAWRKFNEKEKLALFHFFMKLGKMMAIQNLPTTVEELEIWSENYEQKNFRFIPEQKRLGEACIQHFVTEVPRPFGAFLRWAIPVIVGDRLSEAVGIPKAGKLKYAIVRTWLPIYHFMIDLLKWTPESFDGKGLQQMNIKSHPGGFDFNKFGPEWARNSRATK